MKFYGRKSFRPSDLVLVGDQVLIWLGLSSALFANYRILRIEEFPFETTLYYSVIHLCYGILAWIIFGVYKKVIRFFNSIDYLSLIAIVFLIHVMTFLTGFLLPAKNQLRPEVFLISAFITAMYITGSRMIISYLYTYYRRAKKIGPEKRILIYGAGHLGVFLKKSIYNTNDQYKLIAFIDDDKNKVGRFVEGVKVISSDQEILDKYISEHEITDVIIANKSLTASRKAKFLETSLKHNLRIKEISSIKSLLGNFNIDKLASLDINDLLNREVIELFDKHVVEALVGKTVLVTGAAGSIGSEIVRKLAKHNASLIVCVDFSESALYDLQQELKRTYPTNEFRFILTDVRNEEHVRAVFDSYHPHFIYHAAAYKHVPLMEQFPWQAVQINIMATWKIVKLAIEYNAEKFVFISSDKAVHPTSVMGATKRLAEMIVQCYSGNSDHSGNTRFTITRFGNVLGSNGSVVPLFKKQIQQGGPVTVTHPDMTRYFMTIAEACQLVLEASIMSKGGEVFVFDMGQPVKIVDLAKNMIRLAGYVPDVDMQIKFIGERPGEKLYEELFLETEKLTETYNEKIMISKEKGHDFSEAENIISTFRALETNWNPEEYRKAIKKLLPEYKYNVEVDGKAVKFKPNFVTKEYNYQN